MIKKLLPLLLFVFGILFSSPVLAQEEEDTPVTEEKKIKVRPFRIGLKIGVPNLVGGGLEYVTPLLEHKLSVALDYSLVDSDLFEEDFDLEEDIDMNFTYIEGGINYYFFKPGKGLYINASYGFVNFTGNVYDVESEDYPGQSGDANVDYSHNSFGLKIGAKLGGLFYFRPEIGYSFNSLPDSIDIDVELNNGMTETQTLVLNEDEGGPAAYLFSGLVFNIGIGFAF